MTRDGRVRQHSELHNTSIRTSIKTNLYSAGKITIRNVPYLNISEGGELSQLEGCEVSAPFVLDAALVFTCVTFHGCLHTCNIYTLVCYRRGYRRVAARPIDFGYGLQGLQYHFKK